MKLFPSEIPRLLSLNINQMSESQLTRACQEIDELILNFVSELGLLERRFERVKSFEEFDQPLQEDMSIDSQELDLGFKPTLEDMLLIGRAPLAAFSENKRSDILTDNEDKKEKYKKIQHVISGLLAKKDLIQIKFNALQQSNLLKN
jgi:hypothetical protein